MGEKFNRVNGYKSSNGKIHTYVRSNPKPAPSIGAIIQKKLKKAIG